MDAAVALVFAVLAGAATALSPCVLPVLPVALAAGATGGGAARGGGGGGGARARPAATGGDGLRSGLVLGASLALVYAPCAGPILAAVVALDGAVSAERLALGFAYGIGAALAAAAVMTLRRSLT